MFKGKNDFYIISTQQKMHLIDYSRFKNDTKRKNVGSGIERLIIGRSGGSQLRKVLKR
jgi:hypothetical protein